MNISKAARQALIPIERNIMNEPVEHAYFLRNKDGKEFFYKKGHESGIPMRNYMKQHRLLFRDNKKLFTHNHPGETKKSLSLSPNDIFAGIYMNCREVRAVSEDGFCHIAEIPKMDLNEKINCLNKLFKYLVLLIMAKTLTQFRKQYRIMQKEVTKEWGIKFRMIKLPESP